MDTIISLPEGDRRLSGLIHWEERDCPVGIYKTWVLVPCLLFIKNDLRQVTETSFVGLSCVKRQGCLVWCGKDTE